MAQNEQAAVDLPIYLHVNGASGSAKAVSGSVHGNDGARRHVRSFVV